MEVNDAELAILQRAYALLGSLYDHKDVGLEFKKMIKKAFPAASVPEIDAAAPHVARLDALQERLDKMDQARTEREQDESLGRSLARLREAGYTDEGLEKIKKIMIDTKTADPEVAAAYFDKSVPKPGQVRPSYAPSSFRFVEAQGEDDKSFKQLMSDPEGWFEQNVADVLSETTTRE